MGRGAGQTADTVWREKNGRGSDSANTEEDSINYTVCQLLYWYRSNELWKSVERDEKKDACIEPPTLSQKQNRKG